METTESVTEGFGAVTRVRVSMPGSVRHVGEEGWVALTDALEAAILEMCDGSNVLGDIVEAFVDGEFDEEVRGVYGCCGAGRKELASCLGALSGRSCKMCPCVYVRVLRVLRVCVCVRAHSLSCMLACVRARARSCEGAIAWVLLCACLVLTLACARQVELADVLERVEHLYTLCLISFETG